MGKNIPLRIGRKSNRELNPVEKLRKKERDKKNLNKFIVKMNQKANGEFQSKVKPRRSPSPETNDPMLGQLICTKSLREPSMKYEENYIEEKPTEVLKIEKPQPSSLVPLSISCSTTKIVKSDSDSEDEKIKFEPIRSSNHSNDQKLFKTLIDCDPSITNFITSISHLL